MFWILRTGAPWHDLPPDYGGWSNTHRRFIRWRDKVYGPNKRGLNSKVHSAVDAVGNPIRILITSGTTTDCSETRNLIDGLEAGPLLADRGYDSNEIINQAESQGMLVVIPPKKNRKI